MAKKYWLKFGSGDPSSSAGLAPTFIHFIKFDGTTLSPPGITQPIGGVGLYQFTYTPSFSIGFTIDGATTGLSASNRYIFGSLDPMDRLDELGDEHGSTLLAFGTTLIATGATLSGVAATLIAQGSTIVGLGTALAAQGSTLVAQGSTLVGTGTSLVAMGSTVSGIAATLLAVGSSNAAIIAAIGTTASAFGDSSTQPVDLFGYLKRVRQVLEGYQSYVKSTQVWNMYDTTGATLIATKTMTNNSTQVIRG